LNDSASVPKERRPLSPDHAFVVQFRAGAVRYTGRVEHIVSARATHFESVAELLAFFDRSLTEAQDWK
jgi:hypothetical protein